MRKFLLNKLVRDGIVADMESMGQQVESRQLKGAERLRESARKVVEEATEFKPDQPEAKELADILAANDATRQAVFDVAASIGISQSELLALQQKRQEERGAFDTYIYVETVAMADDDPWADYYAREPDRFLEVTE